MKISDAKPQIISEWRNWSRRSEPVTWQSKYDFFLWLQKEKPHLLDFTCSGDKWQRISGWLS